MFLCSFMPLYYNYLTKNTGYFGGGMRNTRNVINWLFEERIFFQFTMLLDFLNDYDPSVQTILKNLQEQSSEIQKMKGFSDKTLPLDEQLAITQMVKNALETARASVQSVGQEIEIPSVMQSLLQLYPHVVRLSQRLQMSKNSPVVSLLPKDDFEGEIDRRRRSAENKKEMFCFYRPDQDENKMDYYSISVGGVSAPRFILFGPKEQAEAMDDKKQAEAMDDDEVGVLNTSDRDESLSASSSSGGLGAALRGDELERFDDADKLHIAVDDLSFEALDRAYGIIFRFINDFTKEEIAAKRVGIHSFKFVMPNMLQEFYVSQPGKFCTIYTEGLDPKAVLDFAERISAHLRAQGVIAGFLASDAKNTEGRDDIPLYTSHASYSESGRKKEELQLLVAKSQQSLVKAYFEHIPKSSRLYWPKSVDEVTISQLIGRVCDKDRSGFFKQSAVDTMKHLHEFGVNIQVLQNQEMPIDEKIRYVAGKIAAYCHSHLSPNNDRTMK